MKKSLFIILSMTVLYTAFTNLPLKGLTPSIAERSFTNRFGIHGFLSNAAKRFRNYRFKKEKCISPYKPKCEKCYRKKKKK